MCAVDLNNLLLTNESQDNKLRHARDCLISFTPMKRIQFKQPLNYLTFNFKPNIPKPLHHFKLYLTYSCLIKTNSSSRHISIRQQCRPSTRGRGRVTMRNAAAPPTCFGITPPWILRETERYYSPQILRWIRFRILWNFELGKDSRSVIKDTYYKVVGCMQLRQLRILWLLSYGK